MIKLVYKFYYVFVIGFLSRFRALKLLIKHKEFYSASSYFPEKKRKGNIQICFEQMVHILKYGEVNEYYFIYGFDAKTKEEMSKYISYIEFMNGRNKVNLNVSNKPYNYLSILRDKFVFGQYLKSLGFNTPKNLYFISYGLIRDLNSGKHITYEQLLNLNFDAFFKGISGERGDDVYHILIRNGFIFFNNEAISKENFLKKIKSGLFVIQEKIIQHQNINSLNKKSINTIRLTTLYKHTEQKVGVFSSTLRLGVGDSPLDNWSQGGLVVNIQENGKLDKLGFYKPGVGTTTIKHPNTNIIFEGYEIPNYKLIVEQALELHKYFPWIPSIGWDIAIDSNGQAVFIEGNDNWAINLSQVTLGGLKKEWISFINENEF